MNCKNWLLLVAVVCGCLVFGCGGSGGGSGGTTTTTGTATNTGGGTNTTGSDSFTVTTVPAAGYVTVANPNVTLNVKLGFTDPNAKVSFTSMYLYDEGNQQVLSPPGAYGVVQSPAGANIDGQEQTGLSAVYAANPANIIFGGWDDVQVTVYSTKLASGQKSQLVYIPTGTDWVTLPQNINATCGVLSKNMNTVKPGGTIEVKATVTPGLVCTSAVFNVSGFTPSKVTINGAAATLPATYKFANTAAPFTLTIDITIPANQTNAFPVSSTNGGDTGPWLLLSGSGADGPWGATNPFFIHT